MLFYDAVIIGGGPAGLSAGLYLSRAKRRAIVLERETFGGQIANVEWIENYPGFADGVSGASLASEMTNQATKYGLQLEQAEVQEIEFFTGCRWVKCAGGLSYTTTVVIIAGGARPKKLGVPGEEELQGKGVFYCALCDGNKFAEREVVVCGGGDAGITEALYLTKLVSKVTLLETMPALTASAVLQERALANPKLQIHTGVKVEAILGDNQVEAIEFIEVGSGQKTTLKVDGVLVRVGLEPNTSYLDGIVPLDSQGQIMVNDTMGTGTPYVLAAGDIRSGSPRQAVTAAGDGVTAALTAERLLQEQT